MDVLGKKRRKRRTGLLAFGGVILLAGSLLMYGAHRNSVQASLNAKLLDAAKRGDPAAVRTYLSRGGDPNAQEKYWAWRPSGFWENLRSFFMREKPQFALEETALMYAAGNMDEQSMELLLKAGADPNGADWRGFTPLMLACGLGGRFDDPADCAKAAVKAPVMQVIRRMRGAGARVSHKSLDGYTALKILSMHTERTDCVDYLLANGADLEVKDKTGATPLFAAINAGMLRTARHLLSKGAKVDVYTSDPNGKSSCLAQAFWRDKTLIRPIVDRGGKFKPTDPPGPGAVMVWAAAWGDMQIVDLLLSSYPNLKKDETVEGKTAVQMAQAEGRARIARKLKSLGFKG